MFGHKTPVTLNLKADLSNWKAFSSSIKTRSRELKALDEAVARYAANRRSQTTRILLASAIFRWHESDPGCPHDILVPLLNQISLDINDGGQGNFGHKFGISIPTRQHPGIQIVVTSSSECANFPMLVEDALAKIGSRRLGYALLLGLNRAGKKLNITRSSARTWVENVGFGTGSVCRRFNEDFACTSGVGCRSAISWQPDAIRTPDGDRPAFIALAHEMIHAYHNALGVAFGTAKDEEAATVGLMRFWTPEARMDDVKWGYAFYDAEVHAGIGGNRANVRVDSLHITENMIRHEHNIPMRTRYCDMILPDETNRV